ncbi:MAG: hypothetical protein JOZ24_03980 [Candidatus Eremiobacteraeota bacterium]|nr:hypothetical protein [Candidatus Eremiobacteraeota bacterium]
MIVTEPNQLGEVVCATFTTRRDRSDPTTTCQAGEHPFFRHETVVPHNQSVIYKVSMIEEYLEDGTFVRREPCSVGLLQKVRGFILAMRLTPRYIRAAVEAPP